MRIGSLCAGYGGLDMGVSAVLDAEPAWFCEYAAGPSKILAHHYPDLTNYHDLTTTDWATVPPVDILTAGWPCQPWSVAGARKGADDERAIWPSIADAIRSLRPRYVALENVSAIVGVGELARAVGDLASLGYDAQWQCVRASDVGAPHRRERCFILATDSDHPEWRSAGSGRRDLDGVIGVPAKRYEGAGASRGDHQTASYAGDATLDGEWARPESRQGGAATSYSESNGWDEGRTESKGQLGGLHASISGGAPLADSTSKQGSVRYGDDVCARRGANECRQDAGERSAVDWGAYGPAIERWGSIVGRFAPAPTEPSRNGNGRLSPLLVEWMMGLPEGWVTAVPDLSRNDQLKALGNGVVPQQAAYAFSGLLDMAVAA